MAKKTFSRRYLQKSEVRYLCRLRENFDALAAFDKIENPEKLFPEELGRKVWLTFSEYMLFPRAPKTIRPYDEPPHVVQKVLGDRHAACARRCNAKRRAKERAEDQARGFELQQCGQSGTRADWLLVALDSEWRSARQLAKEARGLPIWRNTKTGKEMSLSSLERQIRRQMDDLLAQPANLIERKHFFVKGKNIPIWRYRSTRGGQRP